MFQIWKPVAKTGLNPSGQGSATEQSPVVDNNPERHLSNGRQIVAVSETRNDINCSLKFFEVNIWRDSHNTLPLHLPRSRVYA